MITINIVFSVDNNYVVPMCVAAYSVMETSNYSREDIQFYVLMADVSVENEHVIAEFFARHTLQLTILKVNKADFSDFYTSNHITTSAYYRIIIPELLTDVDRFVYLDCDLVVESPIEELFEQQLGTNIIGAVTDLGGFHRCEPLAITNDRYFNSGVLLVDGKKWREDKLTEKLLDYISHNPDKLELHDQDALNALLSDQWVELDNKWNKQTLDYSTDFTHNLEQYRAAKQAAVHKKGISHFTSFGKPWQIYCPHPSRPRFESFYYKAGFTSKLPIDVFTKRHIVNKEKCVVFGTSGLAHEFIRSFPGLDIAYFLDNNQDKHGLPFYDSVIYKPDSVEHLSEYSIYICSSYYNAIKSQLIGLGLIEGKHFYRI